MIAYIANSLAWSAAGFLFGWLVGHIGRDTRGTAVMRELHWRRIVGAVVAILAVATLITSVVFAHRLQQATACQQRFNAVYASALARRLQAAASEQDAQRELILTMARNPADTPQAEAKKQQALRDYLAALDAAQAQRKPLPPNIQCPDVR